jgi:hypothetical protein
VINRKKIIYRVVPIIFLIFINCMVSLQSVKDPNFNANVSKIFIYLHGAQGANSFFQGIGENLRKGFTDYNITSDTYLDGSLSLTSKSELKSKIKSYNPDLIMQIVQTEYSTLNGAKSGAKMEISLYTPDSDKPVWKGDLSSSTGGYGGMGMPSQIASKIISQLAEDGILKLKQKKAAAQTAE